MSSRSEDSIAAILFVLTYLGLCLIGVFLIFTPLWQPFHMTVALPWLYAIWMDLDYRYFFSILISILWFQGWLVTEKQHLFQHCEEKACAHVCTCVDGYGNSKEREATQEIKIEYVAFQGKKEIVFHLKN